MIAPHMNLNGLAIERFGVGTTPNPWYNLANQFTPRNLHDVIKWSRYITVQSPTITEVIRKLSTYPITDFIPDTKDQVVKDKYLEIIKSIGLKGKIEDAGFDHYTIGNVFLSIYFPIHRTLKCTACGTEHNAKNLKNVKFKKYEFHGNCPSCSSNVVYERKDRKSYNIEDMNIVKWAAENVSVNHNPITGESEFYYKIPNTVKKKIMLGDRLFIDSVPWGFVEAVRDGKDFKFDRGNVFHLKNISMGSILEGLGLPPLISFYSLVFYQAVLRKANEAIATDYLAPLRTVFPQGQSANGDPVVSMSMAGFAGRIESAFKKHKTDPNNILVSPVPLGYQNLGGEGKSLLVSAEIDQAEKTMLLGMGVSIELLSGQTNWTSSTVGLRLLENSMNTYVSQIQEFIDWTMMKISGYLNIEPVEVKMPPFKLTDDMALKEFMLRLAEGGKGSFSSMYKTMGMDYDEILEEMKDDAVKEAVNEVEAEREIEIARFIKAKNAKETDDDGSGFQEAKQQAHDIATQIVQAPAENRRGMLISVLRKDEAMAEMVANMLHDYGVDLDSFHTIEEMQAAQDTAETESVPGSGSKQATKPVSDKPKKADSLGGKEAKPKEKPGEKTKSTKPTKSKGEDLPGPKGDSNKKV